MGTATDSCVENIGLDLSFLEIVVPEGEGMVEFSVKELLVDIRTAIDRLGASTKEDLANAERRIHDRIVLVENAAKERAEALETAYQRDLAAAGDRIVALETSDRANQIKWARIGGMAAGIGAVAGGVVAGLANVIS